MLKKIRLKNSTILLLGVVLISMGVVIGFFEYFQEKKHNAFSKMNILLYESEIPDNIESDGELFGDNTTSLPSSEVDGNTTEDNETNDSDDEITTENNPSVIYDYKGILEIPKLNLKRGFLDIDSKYNNVNYNITVINGSTMPDIEKNNLILAAHSGNCGVCYFNTLYKLNVGDDANIYYNKIKYSYKITDIYEVEKDGTVAIYRDYNKNVLTLITCTKNSDTKQTVYILELINKTAY